MRDKTAEIILLDSIGELRAAYPLAEIVFVGGSLVKHGGQSVLEPAAAGRAIVTGFHTTNFEAAVKEFLNEDAVIQLPALAENETSERIAETFTRLLEDGARREKLGANALAVMRSNRGATAKTVEQIKLFLESNPSLGGAPPSAREKIISRE